MGTQLFNAGLIEGTGTLRVDPEASFGNSGRLAPGGVGVAGTLTYEGNWNNGTGTLEIDVGGIAPGTYDRLVVTGGATLGGTLLVKLIDEPDISFAGMDVVLAASPPSGSFTLFDAPQFWFRTVAGNNVRIGINLSQPPPP